MNQKIERALTVYLQLRQVEGLSPRTLADYRAHITALCRHIPEGSDDYRAAALAYLGQEGIAPNTFNFRFKYVKCFFDWGLSEGCFDCQHPLRGLRKRPAVNRVVNIDTETIIALLEQPNQEEFCGLRDFSLIMLSLDCGCRPSEALSLRAEHFNFKENTVKISAEFAKTRRARSIPFSPSTAAAIQELLSKHRPEWDNAPVFCSQDGGLFREISWCHRLQRYAERIGASLSPYSLRHCCALSLLRGGASAFHVQRILGHSNISMTEKYIALTLDDLKQAHSKASLINKIMPPAPVRFRQRKIA